MSELWALALYAFVNAVTPGPNNVILWAAGIQFGFRATVPHIFGTSIGIGSLALVGSTGLGVLVTTFPQVEIGLKIVGSAYLAYLAYRIAASTVKVGSSTVARPLTFVEAIGFQFVNPKAWVFVLAGVTAFRPPNLAILTGSVVMAIVMAISVTPGVAVWGVGGSGLGRFVNSERSQRIVNIVLAVLLLATVAYIWL